MQTAPTTTGAATTGAERPYRKLAGQEPLPGYRLLEPLGRGGFGEVWKAEAPGGLHKAIKFVADTNSGNADDDASLRQEFEAFERVKRIRHPFLLMLERVELLPDDLVMVMELADHQLQDRFNECLAAGHPGVPRDELLGYLADAAEVLDLLSVQHGLQHLDIKPANLFLVCGRVKVGDFGLARRHELTVSTPGSNRGLTPKYVAPEILHGRVDPRSDQYCLALVYFEMLTGRFPYPAKSPQQMMLAHAASAPDLGPLPEGDRAAVAKALAKAPTDRFRTCLEFVHALIEAGRHEAETWAQSDGGRKTHFAVRQTRLSRAEVELPPAPVERAGLDPSQLTGRFAAPTAPSRLVTPGGKPSLVVPRKAAPVEADEDVIDLISFVPAKVEPVALARIWSVVPADRLVKTNPAPITAPDVQALIDALVAGLTPDGRVPADPCSPLRQADGTWACRFPVRPIPGTAQLRLQVLKDRQQAEVETLKPDLFAIRRPVSGGGGLWGRKTPSGLEVLAELPPAGSLLGEARLTGQLYGPADAALIRSSEQSIPQMLEEVRGALQNAEDRRKAARIPTDAPVTLYPVHSDGRVDPPLAGTACDISVGGVCCTTDTPIATAYVYLVFPSIAAVAKWGILLRLTRSAHDMTGCLIAGRFRVDL